MMPRARPLASLWGALLALACACGPTAEALDDGGEPVQPMPEDGGNHAAVDAGGDQVDGGEPPGGHSSGDAGPDGGAFVLPDAGAADGGLVPSLDGGAPADAGGPPSPLGTFDNPILVDTFPFTYMGDTTLAPSNEAEFYTPCAPSIPEGGGAFVFRLHIPAGDDDRQLVVAVDDVPGDQVDIDVHLLSAPTPDACLARDNTQLERIVAPDEVLYVSADTWTNASGVDQSGAFTLSISLLDVDVEACLVNPIPSCDETTLPTAAAVPVEPPGQGGCPNGMALVDDFCIDRYEATLVEILDDSLVPFSPYANPGSTQVRAVSAPGEVPQGYISGVQAAAACANAGKRLCSDVEWLRACQGPSGTTFPYGSTRQPGLCNDDRTCHPAVQYFESGESWIWSELGHPCINQLPGSVDETGANASCVSADGIHDMMGNLHEWTADPAGTFRGGFYADTEINGPGCLYATTAHNTQHWDYSTGFRCCADAP